MNGRVPAEWALMGYKEAGGDETVRFQTHLTRNRVKVAVVSNGGTGGSDEYYWLDKLAERDFRALAESMKDPWRRRGDTDLLIAAMADALNCKRKVAGYARKGLPFAIIVERTSSRKWEQEAGEADAVLAAFPTEVAAKAWLLTTPHIRWAPVDSDGWASTWTPGTQPTPTVHPSLIETTPEVPT